MSLPIRPTDGLVSRLLQQQTRQNNVSKGAGEAKKNTADHVNISHQAREQHGENTLKQGSTNVYGQKQEQLESKLIGLYNTHGIPEPKN